MVGDRRPPAHDVGVIGGGSAGEALVRALDGSGLRVVVFEALRVGGECPYVACIPSKSMLHDARAGVPWAQAVRRRRQLTHDLDDDRHADGLTGPRVDLVRERARLLDAHTIEAGDHRYRVEHLVIATGATPIVPPIEGADACAGAIWTSDDAMTTEDLPGSLVVVGGGVIGTECALLFSRFGSDVVLVDDEDRAFPAAPAAVGDLVDQILDREGVDIRRGAGVEAVRLVEPGRAEGPVEVDLSDGSVVRADRVLVAIGRRPAYAGVGLEQLGVDPESPLPIDERGRLGVDGSVWVIGDAAGRGEYTHLANHHARVVADHLAGSGTRRFDDVAMPACMFTDPPMIELGPTCAELAGDHDVVSAEADLASLARTATDELGDGYLWLAARRSTGCLVAASGIGAGFDQLLAAVVVACDGRVPVARLRQSMQAFPTIGEILVPLFEDLHRRLSG